MKRLLFIDLLNWCKSSVRTPLLLRGARQVGKTHVVRQLGKTFDHFVEINFEKTPDLKKIFEHDLDPARIVRELSLATGKKIDSGKTLLFMDEIQEAPRALLALRYFYEELPQLHLIAAGSLVDFAIEQVGVPVGRVSFLYMYPMSFIEFLVALGHQNLAQEIVNHTPDKEVNEAIHNKLLRLVGEYIAIGGMPSAVYQWVTAKDLKLSGNILQNIKNAYEQDFEKYARKNQIKYVNLLFQKIPSLISQHFKYSKLSTDFRKRELEPALYLLEKAGIVHTVNHTNGNGLPLGAEMNLEKFKLVFLDIGINQAILGLDLKDWFIDPTSAFINKGNISENFVGQELLAYSNATDKHKLYYWHREERGSQAEVDYLIVRNQKVIPVEVKSGSGTNLKSIRIFLDSHKSSPYGIRFSILNYSAFNNILSYPIYAVAGAVDNKEKLHQFLQESE
jgi:predicted AAA+ superfamily ATPase